MSLASLPGCAFFKAIQSIQMDFNGLSMLIDDFSMDRKLMGIIDAVDPNREIDIVSVSFRVRVVRASERSERNCVGV